MHCLHVCECDSVVKVVAVCLLKVASLTKDVSNGGFLQGWKGLDSVQVLHVECILQMLLEVDWGRAT